MLKKTMPVFFMLFFTGVIFFLFLIMQPLEVFHFQDHISVLFPKGWVGIEQRNLLLIIQGLMLLIVIPVYILTFVFSWKYNAYNSKADYDPNLVDNVYAEFVWWGVPLILTAVVGVLTWVKTEQLDPFKPLESPNKELKIQVVALQWKWLFIYPEEQIATLNFIQIPKDTPVHFEITADAPMNSFWIPDLGGQIYAMPNMKTELYLIANQTGDFRGWSSNLSGEGFSTMHFITRASTREQFDDWVKEAKGSKELLAEADYKAIAAPSKNVPATIFQLKDSGLFEHILHKYMHPQEN